MKKISRSVWWIVGILVGLVIIAILVFVWPGPWIRNAMNTPVPAALATVSEADAHTQRFNTLIDACINAGGVPEGNVISGEVKCLPQVAVVETQPALPEAQTAPAIQAEVGPGCITEAEFEALVGVRADIDRTEPCSFHWRGDPKTLGATHPCPTGWICTLGVNDKNYVYQGDDSLAQLEIFSATWRKVSVYPAGDAVYNHCDFLAKVQHEGAISTPQWTAEAGNFSCQ